MVLFLAVLLLNVLPTHAAGATETVCDGRPATIIGTAGSDHIPGTPGPDVIVGGDGNDFIAGLAGDDVICGGAGNDDISAGDGNDRVFGGAGADRLSGGAGNDRLQGDEGIDQLAGGDGNDELFGDATDSALLGGAGDDFCDSGPGNPAQDGCEQTPPPAPPVPAASIGAGTGQEGGSASFEVSLSGAPPGPVTLRYETMPGSFNNSTAVPGQDFTPTQGTLAWPALASGAALTKTVVVPLLADAAVEGSETFWVQIVDPVGATLSAERYGQGTIIDTTSVAPLNVPALNPTANSPIVDATSFLHTGRNPAQTGVAAGTIKPAQAAVVRGRTLDGTNVALVGVKVSILDHPEFGQTLSRADGFYNLAVNGGGQLTVRFEKNGLMPAQRTVKVPWQDYAVLEDVVMLPYEASVQTVTLQPGKGMQVVRGSQKSDADGTRQATVLFPDGVQATMVKPDGSSQALTTLNVRATEFTVGNNGPIAMPAELPPTSGYTYAVELSVDEAVAAGAAEVRFSQPVPFYVENFLDFPAGQPVPTGFYDRLRGRWVPSPNGRVVKILSEANARADLDTNGDDVADAPAALAALGITDAERERLATLYGPGQTLWRVPVPHFSPWDHNWPLTCDGECQGPDVFERLRMLSDFFETSDGRSCSQAGSVIGCESQTLGESLEVQGTPYRLHYQSENAPGFLPARALDIPLTATSVPANLKRVELTITVAGRRFHETFGTGPNQTFRFVWDGLDAFGRAVRGQVPVSIQLDYLYPGKYVQPQGRFGTTGSAPTGVPTRVEIPLTQRAQRLVAGPAAPGLPVAAWGLSPHHSYDPVGGLLTMGTGEQRASASLASGQVSLVPGANFSGQGVDVGPDGSAYYVGNSRVWKVPPGGAATVVAGGGTSDADGVIATQAKLDSPRGLAVAAGGGFYIAEEGDRRLRRVGPDGKIVTIAGTGASGSSGDGGPSTQAAVTPMDVVEAPDGAIYIADDASDRVRRIAPDGTISTFAGTGGLVTQNVGDGGPAVAAVLDSARSVAVADDGSVYIGGGARVRRVGPNGIISTVAGTGLFGFAGDGGAATSARVNSVTGIDVDSDGTIYFADAGNRRIRKVDPGGVITTFAGDGTVSDSGVGKPPMRASFSCPVDVAKAPDAGFFLSNCNGPQKQIERPLPSFDGAVYGIASAEGDEMYQFDKTGRHLRTVNALSGAVVHRFTYDGAGRLVQIEDKDGLFTRIERDASGKPTAIVAPGSQKTTLTVNGDGYLTRAERPNQAATVLTYGTGGLLATLTDARGGVHHYTYDAEGQLTEDEDPAGGTTTLARTELDRGHRVQTTSSVGRVRTYEVERLATGEIRRAVKDSTGAVTTSLFGQDGSWVVTAADGTKTSVVYGPDPRFAMMSPVPTEAVTLFPSGKRRTVAHQRAVTLAVPADPLSVQTLTETVTESAQNASARKWVTVYTASNKTLKRTTPEGRTTTATYDARDRVVAFQLSGPAATTPLTVQYDARGRPIKSVQGVQSVTRAFDSLDRMTSMTDALGRVTKYTYDAGDRVATMTTPGNHLYKLTYDGTDNLTSVTFPSGAVYALNYTADGLDAGYDPPGPGELLKSYSLDDELVSQVLPGGATITPSYDGAGRPTGESMAEAAVALTYADNTRRLGKMTRTPTVGGLSAQSASFTYDGLLTMGVSVSGPATATHTYSYNDFLDVTGITTVAGATVNTVRTYDNDGTLKTDGPFTWTRGGPAAAVTKIGDGTSVTTLTYDALAEPLGRSLAVGGSEKHSVTLTRNSDGEVTKKVIKSGATTTTFEYTYDADGQLTDVFRNGVLAEHYTYDADANRTSRKIGAGATEAATYDVEGRLLSRGGVTYGYDGAGRLNKRGAQAFAYDARGNLVSATVGSATVRYGYDAARRRTSRTEGTATTQYFYADPVDPMRITGVRTPDGVLTTYYYDEAGLLHGFERSGKRYAVAVDDVGTPYLIVDSTGAVVRSTVHDAFGVRTSDSAPGFSFPFGFAGGLYDPLTTLVTFGLRDYEPDSGRWTARDPARFQGGQFNLYAYVGNNPVQLRDPLGLKRGIGLQGSLYAGIGIEADAMVGRSGASFCIGVGAGFGTSYGLKTGSLVKRDGWYTSGRLSAKAGPLGASSGFDVDPCGKTTVAKPSLSLGPISASPGGVSMKAPGEEGYRLSTDYSLKLEAKLVHKYCYTTLD